MPSGSPGTPFVKPTVPDDGTTSGRIERGTLSVLLGPTLAGKTSIMRLLAGLDKPTTGRVLVDDKDVTGFDVRQRSVAMVYQTCLCNRFSGRGGAGRFPQRDDALWDSYLLFDRDASWNSTPSGILSWGSTVMRTRQKLADDLQYASKRAR